MKNKPYIDSQEALTNRYARYRTMLCETVPKLDDILRQGAMLRTSFSELSQQFDVLLLDAFGVLNIGNQPISGSPEAIMHLKKRQQPFLIVSNNASQSPEGMRYRLGKMGFELDLTDIFSSGMAIESFIAASLYQNSPYFLVGSQDSAAVYAPNAARLMVNHPATIRKLDEAEYVLMCSNRDYYGGEQEHLLTQLLQNKRIPLLLANPDLATPELNGGLEAVAGFTAMDLADQFQTPLIGIGKPFLPIFQEVKKRFPKISPDRFLMVGDTLDTDILGAKAMGFASCLTLSGACAGWEANLETLCNERGICPDYVIPCLNN